MILTLVNIGPLKEARVELGRGLTVFYGPNASGKTTVARALRLLALMNMGVADAGELMELINRVKREGRIVYEDGGSVLEISCALGERGAWLKFGGVLGGERRVYPDDRLESTDRPRIAMFWILHNYVTLYGIKAQEGRSYKLADLLTPSVLRGLVGEGKALGEFLDFYEELLAKVNKYLEAFTGHAVEYRDRLYFRRSIHLFHPSRVAKGVRRMALILATALLAEAVAEGATPVVYVEEFESSLHVDYLELLIEFLRRRSAAVVAETHSGFVLRRVYEIKSKGDVRYYIFEDGAVYTEIKDSKLFKREIAAMVGVDML
jgi:energy-coupling factor transporter ATP-binding protein EcfA2